MFAAAITALALASASAAQMTIQVGAEVTSNGGVYQYIPPTQTAANGTVVTFEFIGNPGNHSVTQSSFANPCTPLAGGFDSGWLLIENTPTVTPTWNLTITNATQPIWFFCKQLAPLTHCSAGMVGAINPPTSGNTFTNFQANAAKFSGPSGQNIGGLVGIGASASANIGPISADVTLFGTPATGTATAPAATGTNSSSGAGSATGTGSVTGTGSATGTGSSTGTTTPAPTSGASNVGANFITLAIAALAGLTFA